MGLLKSLFQGALQTDTFIDEWIEKLSARKEDHCEYLRTTRFERLVGYMRSRRAQLLSTSKPFPEESNLYRVSVRGRSFDVRVSRSYDREGVLLTCMTTGSLEARSIHPRSSCDHE